MTYIQNDSSVRPRLTTPAHPAHISYQNRFALSKKSIGARIMAKTITTRYDVAEHLRTPEEMAAYLEACFEEAHGDAAFIAKALGDIARARACHR